MERKAVERAREKRSPAKVGREEKLVVSRSGRNGVNRGAGQKRYGRTPRTPPGHPRDLCAHKKENRLPSPPPPCTPSHRVSRITREMEMAVAHRFAAPHRPGSLSNPFCG